MSPLSYPPSENQKEYYIILPPDVNNDVLYDMYTTLSKKKIPKEIFIKNLKKSQDNTIRCSDIKYQKNIIIYRKKHLKSLYIGWIMEKPSSLKRYIKNKYRYDISVASTYNLEKNRQYDAYMTNHTLRTSNPNIILIENISQVEQFHSSPNIFLPLPFE